VPVCPTALCAEVEEKKIVDYLLKLAHPQGGSKAKFFLARGFAVAEWQTLREPCWRRDATTW
jgi:hypothetical protein